MVVERGGGGDDCKLGTLASSSNCFIISEIFSRWGVFPSGWGRERFGPIEEGDFRDERFFLFWDKGFWLFFDFELAGTGTVGMDRRRDSSILSDGEGVVGFYFFFSMP